VAIMDKNIKFILVTVLIILGFVFYWFEIRPAKIRTDCSNIAPLDTVQAQNLTEKDAVEQETRVLSLRKETYINCLHEHGLSK
jgi:regulatory protein YycH of two-component signal transduction system YycFG